MKAWMVLTAVVLTMTGVGFAQGEGDERSALRERVEARYEVVPVGDGVVLRPKDSTRPANDARVIEIAGGAVLVNGTAVTGNELRSRVGQDADAILRLSYLPPRELRALFAPTGGESGPAATDPLAVEVERKSGESPRPAPGPARRTRAHGDRVRIFGDAAVARDEVVTGQVVAVFGSARVDGEVGDQVVAVFGSVTLGPTAVVGGDVVSIGGRVHRADGAQLRAGVTEVSLSDSGFPVHVGPWFHGWGPFMWTDGFGAVPRLLGTGFRAVLLLLLTGIALLIASRTVEASAERVSENPVKATLVGLFAEILIPPVLVVSAIVLAISIVGIPLLLLLPFVVLLLILMAIVGFAGTAVAIGRRVQRRLAMGDAGTFVSVAIGVLVILSPLLLGRVLALSGWPATPFALLLIAAGFAIELLAWASGFGAVLANAFTRWQGHRTARRPLTSPTVS